MNGDYFPNLAVPLLGRFQVQNAVAAVAAAWELRRQGFRISPSAITAGVSQASWPGRLEVIREQPLVLIDGAHNPAGAREIAAFVCEHLAGRRLRLLYASMRDKAITEITEILFPLAEEIYLTRPEHARAASPDEILAAARIGAAPIHIEPDPARALALACQSSRPEDVVLAAGSLFLVADIRKAMGRKP